ncbi:MAG: hypothetical protein RSD57_19305, partial [Comamonas sp.]
MTVASRPAGVAHTFDANACCAAIAVIDTAKSTDHLLPLLSRSSLRVGSLRGTRSYLGEEGRRITRFTLPVCED